MTVCLIALYTNAVQLTPFQIIDPSLLKIDLIFNINTASLLNFIHRYTWLQEILNFSYSALNAELTIVLLLIVIISEPKIQSKIIFLLLSSCFIGFSFYYFFPSVAPASIIDSDLFTSSQQQTYIKFFKIHNYIPIDNIDGGLIAMPSFHCIWALICQYYLFTYKWLGLIVLPLNLCLIAACLLLGWHYLIDILVSFFIVGSLILISKKIEI